METIKGHFRCYRNDGMENYDHLRLYVYDDVPFQGGTRRGIEYFVWVDKEGIEHHDVTDMTIEELGPEGYKRVPLEQTVPITQKALISDLVLG